MDVTVYSNLALKSAPDRDIDLHASHHQLQLLLGAIGLTGEAGETAEVVKKHVFHGYPLDRIKLEKELGDVLWYLNFLAIRGCGCGLQQIMESNINKLAARYPEGFFSTERSINRAAGDE